MYAVAPKLAIKNTFVRIPRHGKKGLQGERNCAACHATGCRYRDSTTSSQHPAQSPSVHQCYHRQLRGPIQRVQSKVQQMEQHSYRPWRSYHSSMVIGWRATSPQHNQSIRNGAACGTAASMLSNDTPILSSLGMPECTTAESINM